MKNEELTVRTPLGELLVGIKVDPDYPGILVTFRGNGMNDCSMKDLSVSHGSNTLRRSGAFRPSFMVTGMQMTTHSSSSSRTFQSRKNEIWRFIMGTAKLMTPLFYGGNYNAVFHRTLPTWVIESLRTSKVDGSW